MDERFRGKGMWIGLGALALVFLCVMMCGLAVMAMMGLSTGADYIVPPAGEEGAAPPPAAYGYGPLARGGAIAHGPFGFLFTVLGGLFKLAVLCLLLLVGIKLVMRLFWGHGYCGPRHWGKRPKGEEGDWGPPWHAWHRHRRQWGPGWQPPGEDEAAEDYGTPDQEYTAAE